eukprot:8429335-Ditylum_brightwellii.AAC.1
MPSTTKNTSATTLNLGYHRAGLRWWNQAAETIESSLVSKLALSWAKMTELKLGIKDDIKLCSDDSIKDGIKMGSDDVIKLGIKDDIKLGSDDSNEQLQ